MIFKRLSLLILLIVFIISLTAFAKEYYADIKIDVLDSGKVSLEGLTNHPVLKENITDDLTKKQGKVWTLNISPKGMFSEYYYEVMLPNNAKIHYLKMPNKLSVSQKNGRLMVAGIGSNEEFYIIAQYSIENTKKNTSSFIIGLILFFIFLMVMFMPVFIKRIKSEQKLNYNSRALNNRQKQIIKLLNKAKNNTLGQYELQNLMNIPKASLSRNINTLEKKGIICKEQKGMSNIVYLRKGVSQKE